MKLGQVVKTYTSKKGNEVVIRYPKRDDLHDLLAFANALSKEDTYVLLSGETITMKEEKKYLSDSIKQLKKKEKIHIVALVNGTFAGNAEIRRQKRRKSHVGSVSISMAKPFREEGIGTQLLKALISEAKSYNLRQLTIECFEENVRAIHVYEKLGFRLVGTTPGMYLYQGKYVGEKLFYLPLT